MHDSIHDREFDRSDKVEDLESQSRKIYEDKSNLDWFDRENYDDFRSAMKGMQKSSDKAVSSLPSYVGQAVNDGNKPKSKETVNQDGSKMERDLSQRLLKLTYSDGSSRAFERDKNGQLVKLIEPDGSSWNKQDKSNVWINDASGEKGTELKVSYDGTLSYKDEGKALHSIDRTRLHKITNADKSVLEERDGLVQKIKRANGTAVECKYEGRELMSMTINGKETYTRSTSDSTEWIHSVGGKQYPSAGVEIHPDGTCTYQRGDIPASEIVRLDGSGHIDYQNGAHVEFLRDGKVTSIVRPNSTKTEFTYERGGISKISEKYLEGDTAEWKKHQGKWGSMDQVGRSYDNYSISHDGVVTITKDKYSLTRNVDGSIVSKKKDGPTVTYDAQRRNSSLMRRDGSALDYEYADPNSKDKNDLVRITEKTKSGENIWEEDKNTGDWTSAAHPGERRREVRIDHKGDLSYVSLKDDKVAKIIYPGGNSREFEYNKGSISKVTENVSSPTADGKETTSKTVWQRQEGSDSWSNGSLLEERKNVQVSPEGKYSFINEDGLKQCYSQEDYEHRESVDPQEPNDAVKESATKLLKAMLPHITDADHQNAFKKDLEVFQKRAPLRHITDEQVAKTLDTVSELVSSDNSENAMSKTERLELAKQIVRHLAFPRAIDQGWHNTCNVATIQVVTASRQPEKFAGLIKEVATTGQYNSERNVILKPDEGSLKPDFEAKEYKPYNPDKNTGNRSLASQIFQVTAVNAYYVPANSSLRYQQQNPANPDDNGERLLNPKTKSISSKTPYLTADRMIEVSKHINGEAIPLLTHNEVADSKTIKVGSETELQKKLLDLQKNKKLPAIVEVFTAREPFKTEGDGAGAHVVTIWNIDKTGKILMDNQWGRSVDHEGLRRISLSQLYRSMVPTR